MTMMNNFLVCTKESFIFVFGYKSRKLCHSIFKNVLFLFESLQSFKKLLIAVERVSGNSQRLKIFVVLKPTWVNII